MNNPSPQGISLHDQIQMNLQGGKSEDVEAIAGWIGGKRGMPSQESDIDVSFHDSRCAQHEWMPIGHQDAFYGGGRFGLASKHSPSPVEVELKTEFANSKFRIHFSHGCPRKFPLLRGMINASCIAKGWLGVHATAFTLGSNGYLACGWPGSGKTGTLLAYLMHGAEYLATEWVYISDEGQTMHGTPEPIRLRDWHMEKVDGKIGRLGRSDRFRLTSKRWLQRSVDRMSKILRPVAGSVGKLTSRLADKIDRQCHVDLPMEDWIGEALQPRQSPLTTILFVGLHPSSEIRVRWLDKGEAKRRMDSLQTEDFQELFRTYIRWQYAVSDASAWLHQMDRMRRQLLDGLMNDKHLLAVDHPQRVPLPALFQAIESELKKPCSRSH